MTHVQAGLPAGFDTLLAAYPWPSAPAFPDAPPVQRRLGGFALIEQAIEGLGKPDPVILEIGAEFGTSTRRHLAIPGAHVVSIDPWPDDYAYDSFPELRKYVGGDGHMYELFHSFNWDYRERLVAVRAYSPAGPKLVYDAGLRPDLVYIDGNHHFDSVTEDIIIARTLFPEAIIAGDDWRYDLKLKRLEGVSFPVQLAVKRWAARNDVHVVTQANQWLLDPARPFNLDRPKPVFGVAQGEVAQRLQGIEQKQDELLRGQRRIHRSLQQLPSRRVLRGVRSRLQRGSSS